MAKPNLLLVDGDARNRRVLEVSLRKAGFVVTAAVNGIDALEKVEISLPDLIISETQLPELSGFEFCERVKSDARWTHIPFIFLTNQRSIEDKIHGLELGVDEYLIKPIFVKEIVIRIKALLQKRQQERLSGREGKTTFNGQLSDMAVVDIIQTLELGGKSGIIHFDSTDGRHGAIYFREGKIIDAELGKLQGEAAVYRLLIWNEGRFEVEFKSILRNDTIKSGNQELLMEGMRRVDEWGRLLESLPSLDTVLVVNFAQLAERLGEIPDEVNSLLRLFDGRRTLIHVVDESGVDDLQALSMVSKLFFEEIVHEALPTSETVAPESFSTASEPGSSSSAASAKASSSSPTPTKPPTTQELEFANSEQHASDRKAEDWDEHTESRGTATASEEDEIPVFEHPDPWAEHARLPDLNKSDSTDPGRALEHPLDEEEPTENRGPDFFGRPPSVEIPPELQHSSRRVLSTEEQNAEAFALAIQAEVAHLTPGQVAEAAARSPQAKTLIPPSVAAQKQAQARPTAKMFVPISDETATVGRAREKESSAAIEPTPSSTTTDRELSTDRAVTPPETAQHEPSHEERSHEKSSKTGKFTPVAAQLSDEKRGQFKKVTEQSIVRKLKDLRAASKEPEKEPEKPVEPASSTEVARHSEFSAPAPSVAEEAAAVMKRAAEETIAEAQRRAAEIVAQAEAKAKEALAAAQAAHQAAAVASAFAQKSEEVEKKITEVSSMFKLQDMARLRESSRDKSAVSNSTSVRELAQGSSGTSTLPEAPNLDDHEERPAPLLTPQIKMVASLGLAGFVVICLIYLFRNDPATTSSETAGTSVRGSSNPDAESPTPTVDAPTQEQHPDAASQLQKPSVIETKPIADAGAPKTEPDAAPSINTQYQELVQKAKLAKGRAAEALYQQALKLDENGWEALEALARSAMERNKLEQALAHAEKAVRANPQATYAYLVLGQAYLEQGKKEESVVAWKRFLELCPKCPETADIRAFLSR